MIRIRKAVFILAAVLQGCATYQDQVAESRRLVSSGNFDSAINQLEILASKEDGDQLVHLLDYGVALQMAGKLKESNEVLLKADKLAESIDYHSVSRVAGSIVTSEEMVQYKGDTFEKIFINAFLAMNFLELGQLDEALVECRRINEKYLKLRGEDKKNFELNPFAKYLSAVIWEASGQFDDAYIAFDEAYKLSPVISTIREDLVRTAKKSRRMDEFKRWKETFPEVQEKSEWYNAKYGELIVLFQQGWGPRKQQDPSSHRFPVLRSVYNVTKQARLDLKSNGSYKSSFVYDVDRAAIETLREDYGALVARRMGGIVAKEVVADQIRQKNEALGFLAWIFLHVSDRADLRQWSFLPQTIQIIRVPLPPGTYDFSIQGLDQFGSATEDRLESKSVQIKSGRKVFAVWRSLK